jgi:hypothetical protein
MGGTFNGGLIRCTLNGGLIGGTFNGGLIGVQFNEGLGGVHLIGGHLNGEMAGGANLNCGLTGGTGTFKMGTHRGVPRTASTPRPASKVDRCDM